MFLRPLCKFLSGSQYGTPFCHHRVTVPSPRALCPRHKSNFLGLDPPEILTSGVPITAATAAIPTPIELALLTILPKFTLPHFLPTSLDTTRPHCQLISNFYQDRQTPSMGFRKQTTPITNPHTYVCDFTVPSLMISSRRNFATNSFSWLLALGPS